MHVLYAYILDMTGFLIRIYVKNVDLKIKVFIFRIFNFAIAIKHHLLFIYIKKQTVISHGLPLLSTIIF